MAKIYRKKGDTYPSLGYTVRDAQGKLLDMTDAIVDFSMIHKETNVLKVDHAAGLADDVGHISYSWADADVDTEGEFLGEFRVTLSSGKEFAVPRKGFLTIIIMESLDVT